MEEEEEEEEETPPKDPIVIREYSDQQQVGTCTVCGEEKKPYIQIEYGDKTEYTCEECYKKTVSKTVLKCRECGTDLGDDDVFCGKCGAKQQQECPECGEESRGDDAFCGKCGKKL